jgi:hypothetical protein
VIPKAEVLQVAQETGLLATTIEKDYALGWILFGIAQQAELGRWIFKGGTCLKKCFFDTYRFSEDLDFTIPRDAPYNPAAIRTGLLEVTASIGEQTGLKFPTDGLDVRESVNKRGQKTYFVRLTFQRASGPGGGIKAFKVAQLGEVAVTSTAFQARFLVEL